MVPPGQAPLKVRLQWVGITLPIAENVPPDTSFEMGVLGGKPENSGGYPVETIIAIRELEKKAPKLLIGGGLMLVRGHHGYLLAVMSASFFEKS